MPARPASAPTACAGRTRAPPRLPLTLRPAAPRAPARAPRPRARAPTPRRPRPRAHRAAARPPPAWAGFRTLAVTAIVRESAHVVSVRLESPDGTPLPAAQPGQYLTLRLSPDSEHPSILRNYSLSSRPGARYYRITVKHE